MPKPSIPYTLRPREAVRPGLIRILNAMGRDARKLSERPEKEWEETIHGLRTLIKRLRAYLWFLRPIVGKAFYGRSNSTLRSAARRLSKARDLHAVASALNKAASPKTGESEQESLVQISQAFAEQTSQELNRSAPPLEKVADSIVQTISGIVRVAKAKADEWPGPTDRVNKALKRTHKAMKKASRKKDPCYVHEWRKKTKKLFYILQLTSRISKAGKADCLKKVGDLQETLGDFQDNIVAVKHLQKKPPYLDAAHIQHILNLLQNNQKNLLKDARHSGKAIR